MIALKIEEGETIRINVKNKSSSGTGMLSAAGLTGGVSSTGKPSALAPPPPGVGKIKTVLPPPPNDPAAARMTSSPGVGLKGPKENSRRTMDPFSDLSKIERSLPSTTGSASTKSTASGWAAF
ncbi:uncharacterized protein At1g03900-like [Magnolia sinica]|uniref:uncharacterized protein At1g03900-like n=1 Tax=Magnolia sinica TaxID=86752 RepID=UPI00265B4BFE|nr:uncharacterized protein At1g03900-like [Magnolia sinica]